MLGICLRFNLLSWQAIWTNISYEGRPNQYNVYPRIQTSECIRILGVSIRLLCMSTYTWSVRTGGNASNGSNGKVFARWRSMIAATLNYSRASYNLSQMYIYVCRVRVYVVYTHTFVCVNIDCLLPIVPIARVFPKRSPLRHQLIWRDSDFLRLPRWSFCLCISDAKQGIGNRP